MRSKPYLNDYNLIFRFAVELDSYHNFRIAYFKLPHNYLLVSYKTVGG